MHGLIVNQLRNYTVARHGDDAWTTALEKSGAPLPAGTPSLGQTYPDAVVVGVILEVASVAKLDVQDLLRDFGEYLAGGLLRVYDPLVLPEWKTLDVVEHVEQQIHTVVRLRDPRRDLRTSRRAEFRPPRSMWCTAASDTCAHSPRVSLTDWRVITMNRFLSGSRNACCAAMYAASSRSSSSLTSRGAPNSRHCKAQRLCLRND